MPAVRAMRVSEWVIKLTVFLNHQGPYKPCNHDLYIDIIIFPRIPVKQNFEDNQS